MKKQIKPIVAVTLCLSMITSSLMSSPINDVGSFSSKSNATIAETKCKVEFNKTNALPTIARIAVQAVGEAYMLSKFVTSCLQNIRENNINAIEDFTKNTKNKNDTVALNKYLDKSIITCFGHKSILQYSKFVINKINNGNSSDSIFVRYQIFNAEFPRFSKRKLNYYDLSGYKFSKSLSKYFRINNLN